MQTTFSLFNGLNRAQLQAITALMEEIFFPKDTLLIHEGERFGALFFITEGEVIVTKKEAESSREHILATLSEGEVVGEMSWLNTQVAMASVRTITPVRILSLPIDKLLSLDAEIVAKIYENMAKQLNMRLKRTGEVAVDAMKGKLEEEKARSAMGSFIIHLIVLIFLYIYSIKVISLLGVTFVSSSIISFPILAVYGISVIIMIKRSGYPLDMYGLTLRNWKRSIAESLAYTLPVLALLVLFKWVLIKTLPMYSKLTLFGITAAASTGQAHDLSFLEAFLLVAGYCVFTPVQELI